MPVVLIRTGKVFVPRRHSPTVFPSRVSVSQKATARWDADKRPNGKEDLAETK